MTYHMSNPVLLPVRYYAQDRLVTRHMSFILCSCQLDNMHRIGWWHVQRVSSCVLASHNMHRVYRLVSHHMSFDLCSCQLDSQLCTLWHRNKGVAFHHKGFYHITIRHDIIQYITHVITHSTHFVIIMFLVAPIEPSTLLWAQLTTYTLHIHATHMYKIYPVFP